MVVNVMEKRNQEKRHKEYWGWDFTNLCRVIRLLSQRPKGMRKKDVKMSGEVGSRWGRWGWIMQRPQSWSLSALFQKWQGLCSWSLVTREGRTRGHGGHVKVP